MSDTSFVIVGAVAGLCGVESLHELDAVHAAYRPGLDPVTVESAYRAAVDQRLAPHGLAIDGRDRERALWPLSDDFDVGTLVRAALDVSDPAGTTGLHSAGSSASEVPRHPAGG
ncbi:hypothetical protein AB0A74_01505 [Saccharothrix sp. NPDC042600]|uniref:hypothetical protein n=1 Tax=Saccharothrix TaxID=2071 RepID=UPI0033F75D53|nr:hypothetical protein GCM10017745_50140 [Saccharothrix mutabilis subsp. capreolus]